MTAATATATGGRNGNDSKRQQPDGISDSGNGSCSAVMAPLSAMAAMARQCQRWHSSRDGMATAAIATVAEKAVKAVAAEVTS